jgi:MerR family transcriptional regulator, thiopeptide resistance regulator
MTRVYFSKLTQTACIRHQTDTPTIYLPTSAPVSASSIGRPLEARILHSLPAAGGVDAGQANIVLDSDLRSGLRMLRRGRIEQVLSSAGFAELAELAGVTVKALHHYDRLGLLRARRTDAGYRLYSDSDLERLEQIVALKFLGLPLKQIKVVLERAPLELPDALRLQREALEQKQQLLARAIRAIREAEMAITPGKAADPVVLKKLIEVIGMQDDIEVMKQYYSEKAWTKRRGSYEQGPSEEWKDLYRDVEAALGEDPAGEKAQALAERWMGLVDRDSGGDPEVQAGAVKAWAESPEVA